MKKFLIPMAGMALTASMATVVQAAPTEIVVRVISKDAKFIGTSIGGTLITIRDVDSGELLAKGVTKGDTGDTKRIMSLDKKRGDILSTEGAAKFVATLDLTEPRLIEVAAYGPLAQRQSANKVSATQWVVPGKPINAGDGFLLQMPGFLVDVLDPPTHIKLSGGAQAMKLRANVTMMCGCTLEPGGPWDPSKYEVKALLKRNGEAVGELPLEYAGAISQFAATWDVKQAGTYQATVYAYDPANGNTGVDSVTFIVAP